MSKLPNRFSNIEFEASFRVKGCFKGPAAPTGTEPAIVENFIETLQGLHDSHQGLRGVSLPLKYSAPRAGAPRFPTDFMPKAGCGCRKR